MFIAPGSDLSTWKCDSINSPVLLNEISAGDGVEIKDSAVLGNGRSRPLAARHKRGFQARERTCSIETGRNPSPGANEGSRPLILDNRSWPSMTICALAISCS